MLNNKSVLITGGTGSFGQMFVKSVVKKYPKIKRLVIFSRDELKQSEMAIKFPKKKYKFIRFFLGDVRDKDRIKRAIRDIDFVIHAAALKQVTTAEYNPNEFIKTNVLGAQNLIEACLDSSVKKVIALSTDKAAAPINLYGATKLCSDKLFIAANNYVGKKNLVFSVLRYGNVFGSRGSVAPIFKQRIKNNKPFEITHPNMTRFNLTLEQAVNMVYWSLQNSIGGEICVPKTPSFNIVDLAEAMDSKRKKVISGIRVGEKLHEELITISDSLNTFDIGLYYLILPSKNKEIINKFKKKFKKFKKVSNDFSYNSLNNKDRLDVRKLKKIILDNGKN